MKNIFLATGMFLVLNSAQAIDLYRWVGQDGVVHYADTPREGAEKVQLGSFDAASGVDDASLPYETRMAKKAFPVTLYVSEKCGDACNLAHDFLTKRHVPFTEVMIKTADNLQDFKQRSGTDIMPTISVGRAWFKGFQPDDWRNELDADGYPK